MAKNNHYKQPAAAQRKKPSMRKKRGVLVAVIIAAVCIVGALTAAIILFKKADSPADNPSAKSTVICAILYPDLQENGEIWQTGGMQQTTCTTLREALETDFAGIFSVEFDEDGALIALGELRAQDGRHFAIYNNTNQGRTLLTEQAADITLEDALTFEIVFLDENEEQISFFRQ